MFENSWFFFMIMVLVVWRLTHLLTKEDGPFDIIYLLRKKAGAGFFGSLLDCFYCVSIWTALPVGIFMGAMWWEKILYWWALSGAACIIEQATSSNNKNNNLPDYKED